MLSTSKNKLYELFQSLGIQSGDNLIVHSNFISLGLVEGGLKGFYDLLRSIIGSEATLVVPTFTWSFRRNEVFDILKSPSAKSIGVFSEFVRQKETAFRSGCPLFSMAAEGPLAKGLMKRESIACFGEGSIYEKLFRANMKILGLGITYSTGISEFMHLERLAGVDYRKDMLLEGESIDIHGRKFHDSALHFARNESVVGGRVNREPMGLELEKLQISKRINYHGSSFFCLTCRDFKDFVLQELNRDKRAMCIGEEVK